MARGGAGLISVATNEIPGPMAQLCERALAGVQRILRSLGAGESLLRLAARAEPLVPTPPPGASRIVTSRDGNPFA
jgi:dihydrodipicolinate synthase/N-acetylneuraminate lyase